MWFKERTPSGICAYKKGEFEIGIILIICGVIFMLLGTYFINKHLSMAILFATIGTICYILSFMIDRRELKRRGQIIEGTYNET
jgi:hypothetical protein